MKKNVALITSVILMALFLQVPLTFAAPLSGASFTDIAENTRYTKAVSKVSAEGFMSGFEDGTFRITNDVTRLEAVYGIMKAFKADALAAAQTSSTQTTKNTPRIFRDVRKNNVAYAALIQAQENGILEGLKLRKNYFKPSAAITAGEVLHIFNNALGRDANKTPVELRYELKNTFPEGWEFTNDVRLAAFEGALLQKSDGTLFTDPTAKLSRGEFTLLLYRLFETRTTGTGFGMASWYGDGLSKRKVEGEKAQLLHKQRLTAAHRKLPMGTILKVTNEINGKFVDVVVNDSGPYIPGRIIDLSRSAFGAIEDPGAGTAVVKIEVVE